MAKSTAVAVKEDTPSDVSTHVAPLPNMYDTVRPEERQMPSIYLVHPQSQSAKNRLAFPGDVIVALGADDPDPQFLIGGASDASTFDAYILSRRRSYARMPQGEQMEWLEADEYMEARQSGDRDVWVVWQYVVAIPEFDEYVPARLMLTKTSGQRVSKALNFLIDKAVALGSMPIVRFSVGEQTSRQNGTKYNVLQVTATEPTAEGLEAAQRMQGYGNAGTDETPTPAANQPGF